MIYACLQFSLTVTIMLAISKAFMTFQETKFLLMCMHELYFADLEEFEIMYCNNKNIDVIDATIWAVFSIF